jgi:hypothetical protein
MTMEALIIIGTAIGLIIGLVAPGKQTGCLALLTIPVGMFVYIWIWQAQHPENLRSTSALDFIFGPLWPSMGAVAGYALGRLLRPRKSGGKAEDGP